MFPRITFNKNERTDMHVHSYYSDGAHSPSELATMAAEKGLRTIALTDHATVEGIPEMIEAGASAGIYVIPGVELNSLEGDFLGYFVDYQDEEFLAFLEKTRQMQRGSIKGIMRTLADFGIPLDMETLHRYAHPGIPTYNTIARILVDQKIFPTGDAVFSFLLGSHGLTSQPSAAPDAESCIKAIHGAGGIVVTTHPKYQPMTDDPMALVNFYNRMVRLGIAGYEILNFKRAGFQEVSDRLLKILQRDSVVPVLGSNFHGGAGDGTHIGRYTIDGTGLQQLIERLPDHCVHTNMFVRMQWRRENLTPDEFKASLFPREINLPVLEMSHLVERPPWPDFLANPKEAYPFVLIGPGTIEDEKTVLRALNSAGATIQKIQTVRGYPELAWDLDGIPFRSQKEKERALLRFNLERHLYGAWLDTCRIVFFESPPGIDLVSLKMHIRREIGTMKFFRVRYGNLADICFTTFIHIPDDDRVLAECHRLREHGIIPPQKESQGKNKDCPIL